MEHKRRRLSVPHFYNNLHIKQKRMKKVILMAALTLTALTANAQKKWTVTPQVGINISDLQGSDAPDWLKTAAGIIGGAEVEYRPTTLFGVSLGGFYSVKGCKTDETIVYRTGLTKADGSRISTMSMNDHISKYELRYLSFPLMLNFHVWKGLTVKGGIQYSNLMAARVKSETWGYMGDQPEGEYIMQDMYSDEMLVQGASAPEPSSENMINPQHIDKKNNTGVKGSFHKMEWAIPIGASYEYRNVVVDVRYQIGLSKVPRHNKEDKVHNSCATITVGFRL